MIFEQMEFHNVAELEVRLGLSGWRLQRFPNEARIGMDTVRTLGERGPYISAQASGCEIRFVTEAQTLRISLSSEIGDGELVVMKGDYVFSQHRLPEGIIKTIQLEEPQLFRQVNEDILRNSTFSPDVWRFCFNRHEVVFHGVETFGKGLRPPRPEELPRRRWLAYGSSITQGAGSFNYYDSYVAQTARRLGVDAINLGMGGCCRSEPSVADFLAARGDWDFATLELGINMLGDFTPDEYENRVRSLISKVRQASPEKPVFLITLFPSKHTIYLEEDEASRREREFKLILRRIAAESTGSQLVLLDGSAILHRFAGLSGDLIHPGNFGHTLMAEKLSRMLSEALGWPLVV